MIAAVAIGTGALIALRPTRGPAPAATPAAPPTPTPVGAPAVLPGDPIRGHPDAPLTIIEFADFTCPTCAAAESVLQELRGRYGFRLRIVWKDLPHLDRLTGSASLHVAAACAYAQGRFWEYHDALYRTTSRDATTLRTLARSLALDLPAFDACVKNPAIARRIDAELVSAASIGVAETPTFFVNGIRLEEPPTIEAFERLLESRNE